MRRVLLIACVVVWSSPAYAEHVASVGVGAGFVAAASPARAAPAVDVTGTFAFTERFFVGATIGGWTLSASDTRSAGTEGLFALSAGVRHPLSRRVGVALLAGPALAVVDRPTSPTDWSAGLWFSPVLEVSTRRPSLSLQLAGRGLWFNQGLRLGAVVGVSYSFR